MAINNKLMVVESDMRTILISSWNIIRPHFLTMTLIWAVFYIPTNIFILIRSGDMIRNISRGSSGVVFLMVILNLLGTIPNIAMVLLVKEGDCNDFNSLVASSFKSLPVFITTTLSMIISMFPLIFLGIAASAVLFSIMDKIGVAPVSQVYIALPVILLSCFLALIRYYSSVNFYLMKGIRNFRAARASRILFSLNRKKVLFFFGLCSFLPMVLNFSTLYLVESEPVNIITGFILGYYMFISSGFFAGMFRQLKEDETDIRVTE